MQFSARMQQSSALKIHLCTMTEEQQQAHYETALRTTLQMMEHTILACSDDPLQVKLQAAQECDLCILLLGRQFGPGDPLSIFSHAELEAYTALDHITEKVLIFAQVEKDHPASTEQQEFIERMSNFESGKFISATVSSSEELMLRVSEALLKWKPREAKSRTFSRTQLDSIVTSEAAMISSTGEPEMRVKRNVARAVLAERKIPAIDYLYEPSESIVPREWVISRASECRLLLLILGRRYGYISSVDGLGATELEFITALQARRPILAFLGKEVKEADGIDQQQFIERVHALLPAEYIFSFSTLEDLRSTLQTQLEKFERGYISAPSNLPEITPMQAHKWYRQQLYRWLGTLPHLTQPGGMLLEDVYVPLETIDRRDETEMNDPYMFSKGAIQARHALQQFQWIEIDKALQRHSHIVLRGGPGSGKSISLHRYATNAPDGTTPIFVRLANYARALHNGEVKNLFDYIVAEERRFALLPLGKPSAWLSALRNGTGRLLLDALDTVPQHQQLEIAKEIGSLASQLDDATRIVVTTRITGFPLQFGEKFIVMPVMPLSPQQQEQLVGKWFEATYKEKVGEQARVPERTQRFLEVLKREPRLMEWASSPLILTFLAALADSSETTSEALPTTKAALYHRVLRLILARWGTLSLRNVGRHIWLKEHTMLELARQSMLEKRSELLTGKDIAQAWATVVQALGLSYKEKADEELQLDEIRENNELLLSLGNDRYSFLHATFQEYLAAKLIATFPIHEQIEQVARNRLNNRWEEVTQFLVGELDRLGRHEEADKLVWTLVQADTQLVASFRWRDPLHLTLLRAAKCQGGRELAYSSVGPGIYLAHTWWHIWHLGVTDNRFYHAVPSAEQAFVALGPARGSILAHLRQAMGDPQLEGHVWYALRALGFAAIPVVEDLREDMKSLDTQTRVRAIKAIGYLGQAAIPALDDLCQALYDGHTAWHAIETFIRLGPVTALVLDKLCLAMKDFNEYGRECVIRILANLWSDANPALNVLLNALHDPAPKVRLMAMQALGTLGSRAAPAARDFLKIMHNTAGEDLQTQDEHWISIWAIRELGDGATEIEDDLCKDLLDPDAHRREDVLFLFGQLGPVNVVLVHKLAFLCEALLNHPDMEVRRDIATALGYLGKSAFPALDALREASHNPAILVRIAAIRAIEGIGPKASSALSDLHDALYAPDADASLCIASLEAISALGPTAEALDDLRAMLSNPDKEIQKAAILAIRSSGQVSNVLFLDPLRQFLHDPDIELCSAAAMALEAIRPAMTPVLHDLFVALKDGDVSVRKRIIQTINDIGMAAIGSLKEQLMTLRRTGLMTREDISLLSTSATVLENLHQAASDRNAEVREQVLLSLGTLGAAANALFIELRQRLKDSSPLTQREMLIKLESALNATLTDLRYTLQNTSGKEQKAAALALARFGPLAIFSLEELYQLVCNPVQGNLTSVGWATGTIGRNLPHGSGDQQFFEPPYDEDIHAVLGATLASIEDAGWVTDGGFMDHRYHTQDYHRIPIHLSLLIDHGDW